MKKIIAILALALVFPATSQALAASANPGDICLSEAAKQETSRGIPAYLLQAISLTETGRWDDGNKASFAWPWTVTAEGRGRYFPNKGAALAEVRRLQAKGISNIDVGCMQINLKAHPDAFTSIEQAFDPATNVAYGAKFLGGLYERAQVWTLAAARYHSHTPQYAQKYRAKLMKLWTGLRNGTQTAFRNINTPATQPMRSPAQVAAIVRGQPLHGDPAAPVLNRTEIERAQARAEAEQWRAEKLAAYQERRRQIAELNQ